MREFKIRIWDVKDNCWYYTVPWKPEDHNVLDTYYFEDVYQDEEDYIWEQYTGLKDKNGREIYEGDIVKISDAPAVSGKFLVVKFDEFDIGEYNCNKMTGWMVQVINGEWAASLADVISSCEVIGNIHENPELLGGEE